MPFKDPLKRRQARQKSEAVGKVADDAAAAERNLAVIKRTLAEGGLQLFEASQVLREFARDEGRFGSEFVRLNMAQSILSEHGVTSYEEARRLLLHGKLAELRLLARLVDDAKDTDRSLYGESLDAIIESGREVGPTVDVGEMAVENLEMGEREYERERQRDARRHGSPWNVYKAGEPIEADIAQTHTSWWPRYRDQLSESYPERTLAGWRWIRRDPSIVCDCCKAPTWHDIQFEPYENDATLIVLRHSMNTFIPGQEFRVQDDRLTWEMRLWSAEDITRVELGWRTIEKTRGRGKKITEEKPGPTYRSAPLREWAEAAPAQHSSCGVDLLFALREPLPGDDPWPVFAQRKSAWNAAEIGDREWMLTRSELVLIRTLSDVCYHIFHEKYTWSKWLTICAKHDEFEATRRREEQWVKDWQNGEWTASLDQLSVQLFDQGDIVIGSYVTPDGVVIFDDFEVGEQFNPNRTTRGQPEAVLVLDDEGHWVKRRRRPIQVIYKARRGRPYFKPVEHKFHLAHTVSIFHDRTDRTDRLRHYTSLLRANARNLYIPPRRSAPELGGTRHITRYAELVEAQRNQ